MWPFKPAPIPPLPDRAEWLCTECNQPFSYPVVGEPDMIADAVITVIAKWYSHMLTWHWERVVTAHWGSVGIDPNLPYVLGPLPDSHMRVN